MITTILFTLMIHSPVHKEKRPIHREHLYYDTTPKPNPRRKNRKERRAEKK